MTIINREFEDEVHDRIVERVKLFKKDSVNRFVSWDNAWLAVMEEMIVEFMAENEWEREQDEMDYHATAQTMHEMVNPHYY